MLLVNLLSSDLAFSQTQTQPPGVTDVAAAENTHKDNPWIVCREPYDEIAADEVHEHDSATVFTTIHHLTRLSTSECTGSSYYSEVISHTFPLPLTRTLWPFPSALNFGNLTPDFYVVLHTGEGGGLGNFLIFFPSA